MSVSRIARPGIVSTRVPRTQGVGPRVAMQVQREGNRVYIWARSGGRTMMLDLPLRSASSIEALLHCAVSAREDTEPEYEVELAGELSE